MPKGFWFLFGASFFVFVALLVFSYNFVSEKVSDFESMIFEPAENFVVKESQEGKTIFNANLGLKCQIPSDWQIEKELTTRTLFLFPPGTSIDREEQILKKGCLIGINAQKGIKEQLSVLQNTINSLKSTSQKSNSSVILVGEIEALKEEDISFGLWQVQISTPYKENIIYFRALSSEPEKNECSKIFERFLDTVTLD